MDQVDRVLGGILSLRKASYGCACRYRNSLWQLRIRNF